MGSWILHPLLPALATLEELAELFNYMIRSVSFSQGIRNPLNTEINN